MFLVLLFLEFFGVMYNFDSFIFVIIFRKEIYLMRSFFISGYVDRYLRKFI